MKFGVKGVKEGVKGPTFCSCPALYSTNKHGYLDKLRSRHDDRAALVFGDPEELISAVPDSLNRKSFK